jgi:hypothetical protein
MTNDEAQNLANGIVARAAEDYATAFMGGDIDDKKPESVMREIEKWVHGDFYQLLTSVDGDWLLRNVKIRELERVLTAYKAAFNAFYTPSIKLTVNTPKGQDNIIFNIPPRLFGDFMEVIRKQIKELEAELKELRE